MAGRSMSWGQGEERECTLVNTVVPLDATTHRGMWPYDAEQKKGCEQQKDQGRVSGVRSCVQVISAP